MEPKIKILILDDEADVTDLLIYKLSQKGYDCKGINNSLSFIDEARVFLPNLIILDIMMPGLSGLHVANLIRNDRCLNQIPIIFLTALGEAEDRIKGLELGADDYVSKPFNSKELILRVGKILGRKNINIKNSESVIKVGKIVLNSESHEVHVNNTLILLTATEFRLLKVLMERKNRVQTREGLLNIVWNYDTDMETRTIDTHIRRLREKLGENSFIIKTIRGVGYKMVDVNE